MSTPIEWIKNKLGQIIYPVTHAKAVIMSDGLTLDENLNNIKKNVSDLSSEIGNYIRTDDKRHDFNVKYPSGTIEYDISKEGYTPIGIVGFTSSHTFIVPARLITNVNSVSLAYSNTYGSAFDGWVSVKVLYKKKND